MHSRRFLLLVTPLIISICFFSCNQHIAQDANNIEDIIFNEHLKNYQLFQEQLVSILGEDIKIEPNQSLSVEEKLLQVKEKQILIKQKSELFKEIQLHLEGLDHSNDKLKEVEYLIKSKDYPEVINSSALRFYKLKLSGEEERLANLIIKEFPSVFEDKEDIDEKLFEYKTNQQPIN
jgi:hypothetical protein